MKILLPRTTGLKRRERGIERRTKMKEKTFGFGYTY